MAARKTLTIQQRYFIQASPKKVFRAISEPKRLTRWFLVKATLTPRKGGRYSFGWQGGYSHSGKVLGFVRGRRLVLTWPQYVRKQRLGETKVTFTVEPRRDGSVLKIVHSGFPKDDRWLPIYGGSEAGWAYFCMNLKSVLEEGRDLRSKHDG